MALTPRTPIECVVTAGVFRFGGVEQWVRTNVWIVGDERRAVVIDPAHDHVEILRALGDREVMAVLCTHGHNDHIDAAVPLADYTDAPILLHPEDEALWNELYPRRPPDAPLLHDEVLKAGGVELWVLHTPGHTPGSVSLYAPIPGAVFLGDALHPPPGEESGPLPRPAALAGLPPGTAEYPGHGP